MKQFVASLLLLGTMVPAQAPRVVFHLDGSLTEHPWKGWSPVFPRGEATYERARGRFVEGIGALRIGPRDEAPRYSVSLGDIAVQDPEALLISVFQEGTERVEYKVQIYDEEAARGKDWTEAAVKLVSCSPGWSEVKVDLRGLRNYTDSRDISVASLIKKIEFGRSRGADGNPGFILDNVRVVGERSASQLREETRRARAVPDGSKRAAALARVLPFIPEPDRLRTGLELVKSDRHDEVLRIAREALSGLNQDASAKAVAAAAKRARGPARLDLLAALAAMPSLVARNAAWAIIVNPRAPAPERTAVITGLARRSFGKDLAGLVEMVPANGPWQPRAALVRTLMLSGDSPAVGALIRLLRRPGTARVQADILDALTRLTGKDMGTEASLWEEWWQVNRAAFATRDLGAPPKRDGYAFFGIPVTQGRIVFVMDVSGSMRDQVVGGNARAHIDSAKHLRDVEVKSRLDLARAELVHALEGVEPGSYVGIVVYNDEVHWVTKGLEKATTKWKEKIKKRVGTIGAKFWTNIHDGLHAAFHPGRKPSKADLVKGPDTIFLLTDGVPSRGPITSPGELHDAVLRWNLGRAIRINTVHVGNEKAKRHRAMLEGLAQSTGGRFVDLSSPRSSQRNRGRSNR